MRMQAVKLIRFALATSLFGALVGFSVEPQSPQLGTYITSIANEDIPADVPADARGNFVGKWELTFAKEDKFHISKSGDTLVEGSYAATKELLTLTDEKGPLACGQDQATGTYKWMSEENKLKLTAKDDGCTGRRFVLTLRSWERQK